MERSFQFVFRGVRGDSDIRVSVIQNEIWFVYDDLYYAFCLKDHDQLSYLEEIYLSSDERRLIDTSIFPNALRPLTGELANLKSKNSAVCINLLAVYKLAYRADRPHGSDFRYFLDRSILTNIRDTLGKPTIWESILIKFDLALYMIKSKMFR